MDKIRALKEKLMGFRDFIFIKPMDNKVFNILFVYAIFLILVELMSYQNDRLFVLIASRTWLLTGIIISVVILFKGMRRFYLDIVEKRFIFLIGSAVTVLLLLRPFIITEGSVIGQDATQQMAAGLKDFSSDDWNYTGKAFLGYPARQYLIAALPATILGRTQFALRLGFALPFWTGLLLFGNSIRDYLNIKRGDRKRELLVVAAVTTFFAFPYITEYYIYFEHTLFPVCFFLQLIGWFLYFIKKPTLFNSLALIWSGSMLIYCYTTALAAVALAIFIISSIVFISILTKSGKFSANSEDRNGVSPNRYFEPAALMALLVIVSQLVFSFLFGRGDRVTDLSANTIDNIILSAKTGLQIGLTNEYAIYTHYTLILWIYFALSLLFVLGKLHFVISIWTLGVFMLSQVLKGYAVYLPQISYSRTLVTVPVLITAWFLILSDLLSGKNILVGLPLDKFKKRVNNLHKKDIIITILLVFIVIANCSIGYINISKPLVQGDAAKYFAPGHLTKMHHMVKDLSYNVNKAGFSDKDDFDFILYTDDIWLKNPKDYLGYFYPNANNYVLGSGEELPENIDMAGSVIIYIINATPPESVLMKFDDIETAYINDKDNRPVLLKRIIKK
jgi:hypothetical protein